MTFEAVVGTVRDLYTSQGIKTVVDHLGTLSEKDLGTRILECRCLEEAGEIESAESTYFDVLETHTGLGIPCPLGLLHYLGFVTRVRGLDDALAFLDDLIMAESEHVTPELFPAIAIGLIWPMSTETRERRLSVASDVFRRGLNRLRGQKRIDLLVAFASFLGLAGNELKLAQLELSSSSGTSATVWKKWEEILLEFNADLSTIKNMHHIFKKSLGKKEQLVEDVSGVVTLSDHPEAAVDSWLLTGTDSEKIIKVVMEKFRIGRDIWAPSSVLESVLGAPSKCGTFGEGEGEELVDGGIETTNHVYRPDVTQMLKFSPVEDMERKAEIPTVLKNLLALLPERTLKHANTQYIAEQCVRLLVSITMPPKLVTEETYANADKRARAAYELKFVKQVPAMAPTVAVAKEKPEEDATQRVKKEQY